MVTQSLLLLKVGVEEEAFLHFVIGCRMPLPIVVRSPYVGTVPPLTTGALPFLFYLVGRLIMAFLLVRAFGRVLRHPLVTCAKMAYP